MNMFETVSSAMTLYKAGVDDILLSDLCRALFYEVRADLKSPTPRRAWRVLVVLDALNVLVVAASMAGMNVLNYNYMDDVDILDVNNALYRANRLVNNPSLDAGERQRVKAAADMLKSIVRDASDKGYSRKRAAGAAGALRVLRDYVAAAETRLNTINQSAVRC